VSCIQLLLALTKTMDQATDPTGTKQAKNAEEIKPLIELCKAGRLFEVQEWITAGKPVDPPPQTGMRTGPRSPLQVAIDAGFHSLVQVLLQGGAAFRRIGYSVPVSRALEMRRFDIVQLLIENGYDAASIPMTEVFATWQPSLMEYFIDRGADVENGDPLAWALCHRIQTALRVLKRYHARFPIFQRQADIALRHHCKQGNLKWVSLMLWAGADPYSPGPESPNAKTCPENEGYSALALAALHRHYEVFQLKKVKIDPHHPTMQVVALWSCHRQGMDLLMKLLGLGMPVNDQDNGGCSLLRYVLQTISWSARRALWGGQREEGGVDSYETRGKMEVAELLVRHGARWVPRNDGEVNDARRSLLKLVPKYTLDFVTLMAKHRACARERLEQLLRTGTIKSHIAKYDRRIRNLVASMPA